MTTIFLITNNFLFKNEMIYFQEKNENEKKENIPLSFKGEKKASELLKIEELKRIPRYPKGKGLPIGNMTSQLLAVYFLNDLDHYIKERLHCKYYIRYMDDFVIFDHDKERLKELKIIISEKLKEFKLELNKKTNIYDLNHGFGFLGYRFLLKGKKLIIKINPQTKRRIKKKMRKLRNVNAPNYEQVKASYMGYLKQAHTKNLLKKMDL